MSLGVLPHHGHLFEPIRGREESQFCFLEGRIRHDSRFRVEGSIRQQGWGRRE
ncbi:hypothetical protein [Thermicanus aegyptius]|uniref:hypothetical protein n=1 Tax=Thermicanus aegyptius TaxID=94009 RepID=UPI0004211821|nr:hypothetical protein [Thermicanus aegyptius]